MRKIILTALNTLMLVSIAAVAFAADGGVSSGFGLAAAGIALGIGVAAAGGSMGQGNAIKAACEGVNLAEIFLVSSCGFEAAEEGATTGTGSNFADLTVGVTEARGEKCPRCWMHSEKANAHPRPILLPPVTSGAKLAEVFMEGSNFLSSLVAVRKNSVIRWLRKRTDQ